MTVAELMIVLAHMPPEAEVHVDGAYHVSVIRRSTSRVTGGDYDLSHIPTARPDAWGIPSVTLGGRTRWYSPPPPYEIRCRVRDKRGLDAELEALTGVPA